MRSGLLLALAVFLFQGNAISGQVANPSPAGTGSSSVEVKAASPSQSAANPAKSDSADSSLDEENQRLAAQISHTLASYPALAGCSFQVKVSDSKIELSGNVPSTREKETAHRIAQSYGNNRSVVDTDLRAQSAINVQAEPSARQGSKPQK